MKIVTLHYETERHTGRASLIGILINKKIETEKTSFANGGPYKTLSGLSCKAGGLQNAFAELDYRVLEALKSYFLSEFHHITGRPVFKIPNGATIHNGSLHLFYLYKYLVFSAI